MYSKESINNNPNIPSSHKKSYDNQNEYKQPEQKPIVEFKYYNPQKPKQQQPQLLPNNMSLYPFVAPNLNYNPVYGYANPFVPSSMPVTVLKNYNIDTSGPTSNHQLVSMIYEDILPQTELINNNLSLNERINLFQVIRSSIFNNIDGSNITFDGTQPTLLSYIKFADLYPYGTKGKNVYNELPYGFLLYRSCYPIRQHKTMRTITCAKDSTAINVRIYRMTEGSFNVGNTTKFTDNNFYNYDEWRDVSFYQYVKEHILKKKICPNFVLMYGYFVSNNANVNFDNINKKSITSYEVYNRFKSVMRNNTVDKNTYLGKALVLLTESPTYSIIDWATNTYIDEGTIKKMARSSFHTDNEWLSIIFQILSALYTMQINNIYIKDFSLERNVLIKDLPLRGSVINHWKYIINGIEYYIPNYGYLVQIDSDFRNKESTPSISEGKTIEVSVGDKSTIISAPIHTDASKIKSGHHILIKEREHKLDNKIDGSFLGMDANTQKNVLSDGTVEDKTKKNITELMKNIFNNFSSIFPSATENAKLCANNIVAYSDENIGDCIYKVIKRFFNNRIGTFLKESEIAYIRNTHDLKKGNILVYEVAANTYKFVLFIKSIDAGKCIIYNKIKPSDNIVIEETVNIANLKSYSNVELITQNFKPNESNLNEDDLIETYIINN